MSRRLAKIAAAAAVGGAGFFSGVALCPHPVFGDLKEQLGTFAYKNFAWPVIRFIDAEKSHSLTIWLAKNRLTPIDRVPDDPILKTKVFGITFPNPLGLAAGCDKQVQAPLFTSLCFFSGRAVYEEADLTSCVAIIL